MTDLRIPAETGSRPVPVLVASPRGGGPRCRGHRRPIPRYRPAKSHRTRNDSCDSCGRYRSISGPARGPAISPARYHSHRRHAPAVSARSHESCTRASIRLAGGQQESSAFLRSSQCAQVAFAQLDRVPIRLLGLLPAAGLPERVAQVIVEPDPDHGGTEVFHRLTDLFQVFQRGIRSARGQFRLSAIQLRARAVLRICFRLLQFIEQSSGLLIFGPRRVRPTCHGCQPGHAGAGGRFGSPVAGFGDRGRCRAAEHIGGLKLAEAFRGAEEIEVCLVAASSRIRSAPVCRQPLAAEVPCGQEVTRIVCSS